MPDYDLIAILGPTASGKTPFAAALAAELHTEIISADSRQIYRGMDLGTGKDLADYTVDGKQIPHHLIDIAAPGYKYNVCCPYPRILSCAPVWRTNRWKN